MGDQTAIEWTDHTFNAWWGCSRISPACRFCYADRDASRWGHQLWRRNGERRPMSEDYWRKPAKWNRDAEKVGKPAKVFCASMSDVFEDHPQVAPWRDRLWGVIESTPWLTWQLLTKRIENVADMVPWSGDWPRNVWIGCSVETQRFAEQRIPKLLRLTGAAERFVSCEPLLGPLDLTRVKLPNGALVDALAGDVIDPRDGVIYASAPSSVTWVISGGESGPKARPSHPEWFRSLRDQCQRSRVPHLFKQWGEWTPDRTGQHLVSAGKYRYAVAMLGPNGEKYTATNPPLMDETWASLLRKGKKAAGRELDGRTWDQFPRVTVPEVQHA